uniref:Uncharacterized protein n=1 Tax=Panagrolaimus sp. PS1159 TaxID=55785 RepID=A0AC35FRM8_9BILA
MAPPIGTGALPYRGHGGGFYRNPYQNPYLMPLNSQPFGHFGQQQQQLNARRVGAPEAEVKQHVEKYVKEILPPEKFQAFQEASNDFDRRLTLFRRGKRETSGSIPRRFDTVTFRNRKTKKPPQKLEITDKNQLYDFMEVQKDARTLDNLIEHQ